MAARSFTALGGSSARLGRMIPFSILDLSPIPLGATAADALRNTLALAQRAETLGYRRYWLAEHHNMPGIACAATSIVIGHVAGGTRSIRVGAGGIMLPNHSPLVIAEQFGTLASLYPGRIDLGLGRAPGTDHAHRARPAARRGGQRRAVPAGRAGAAELLRAAAAAAAHSCCTRSRSRGPDLAAGIESVQRAARGHARLAVRVRLALRAGPDDGGARPVPPPVRAFPATGAALRHARRKRPRRRFGRAGAPPLHLAAAVLHQPAARNAGPGAPADRRHRLLLVSRREGDGRALAGRFVRRFDRRPSSAASRASSTPRSPTS